MAKRYTARGNRVDDTGTGVPTEAKRSDGQYADHYVAKPEQRTEDRFVEPLRTKYRHVGPPGPRYPLRDLTPEENERWNDPDDPVVAYEEYPESERPALGRIWTQCQLDKVGKGCGSETTMPMACAETYAAQPGYYGSTFCAHCGGYFPVGKDGEFVWVDNPEQRVGTRTTHPSKTT